MSPPAFGDLGKAARDVFGKGYTVGVVKLDVKAKSDSGVEFNTSGVHVPASGKVSASLETKYKCSDHGVTMSETWNSDNTLSTDISVEDKLAKGLKLVLANKFVPSSGQIKGAAKATFKADSITLNGESSLDLCPNMVGAGVIGYQNWLVGGQVGFDTAKSSLTKTNLAIGYVAKDYTLHTYCNDGAHYGGSLYQKINKDLESAVDISYSPASNSSVFGLGCKYNSDRNSSVRAKFNSNGTLGLGYQHKLRDGVTATFATLIDAKNLSGGGEHKIGMALEFA